MQKRLQHGMEGRYVACMIRNFFLLCIMLLVVLPLAGTSAQVMEECEERMAMPAADNCPASESQPAHHPQPDSSDCNDAMFLTGCQVRTTLLPSAIPAFDSKEQPLLLQPIQTEVTWGTRTLQPPLRPPIRLS